MNTSLTDPQAAATMPVHFGPDTRTRGMSHRKPLRPTGWQASVRRALACIGAFLGLALFPLPAWSGDAIAVQLSWTHQFQFAGYYVAKERGYYAAEGLDVELRPGGPSAPRPVDAVTSGRAEFGSGNSGLAADRMNGAPVVVLAAVLQSSPAVWVVPGIHDPFDLTPWRDVPRSLPFRPADSSELLIPLARLKGTLAKEEAGGPSVPLQDFGDGPLQLRAAYRSREVYDLSKLGVPFTVLDPRDHGVDFYGDLLFTTEAFLRNRPGTVARFRAATLRGWSEAFADIEGTARLIHRLYAPGVPLEALIHEGRVLRKLARPESVELGHMSIARWTAIGQLQLEHGFGQRPLDVEAFVQDRPGAEVLLWPDPVRVTLFGLLLTLLISGLYLLRINSRLLRQIQGLVDADRTKESEGLRAQFLMDVAPFPIAIYTLKDGRILYSNDRALAWSGAADMLDRAVHDWIPALAPGEALAQRLQSGRTLREHEVELPASSDGSSRWCAVTGRAVEYDGRHCAFIAFSDISDRKLAERDLALLSEQRALILRDVEKLQLRLREASLLDALTGLHNRRYFDSTAPREFSRCRRDQLPIGMLMVDADNFKSINDRFGHAGGDEVLKALGSILARSFRDEDLVCRFGGEEFVILIPGSDETASLARAEMLRQAVEACEVLTPGGRVRFSVSVGVSVGNANTDTPQSLFDRADRAVYAAKSAGRNCVRLISAPAA